MFAGAYAGRRVWLSGHTGFKGSWLALWLTQLGAEVHGFALAPPTRPSLFEQLGLEGKVRHEIGDVRDPAAVQASLRRSRPDFVFHLAAQPLVRFSYAQPLETYQTNVMGTVHVLEALRAVEHPCAAVMVTTDKCYENREWHHSYREEDSLGGFDPYSSSKAAAEIAIAAYRRSFFHPAGGAMLRLASARAGNVIGGGDWAQDRIIPDSVRALERGETIPVRNKISTRPWQHVLEPLSGYLALAQALAADGGAALAGAFNFGPSLHSNRTVAQLVEELLRHWPGAWSDQSDPKAVHEAKLLNLATDKAFHLLAWRPVWDFEETVAATAHWYRRAQASKGAELLAFTREQIEAYQSAAAKSGLPWTKA